MYSLFTKFWKNTFESLSIRNYRFYFTGQAISLTGSWMQVIAQGLLILKLTGSGTQLGLTTALQFLPILFLGPVGGLIVDRFSKRKILYFTQTLAGSLALILGLLVLTNTVKVWMVDILALCLGLITALDNPARQTFIPEMVGEKLLPNAIILNSWEINLTRVIGPSIAGIIAATIGLTACFLLNAASYIAVLIALFLMDEKNHNAPTISKTKGQLKEGLKYAISNPVLRNTLLMMALVGTFTYEFTVILPLVAHYTFHNLTQGYAQLTAAMGLGAVIGGLFFAGRRKVSPQMLVVTSFLFGIAMLFVTFSPTLLIATLAMVLVGAVSINFNSIGSTMLQLESIPQMRGRVMSLWTVAFLGSTPIGGPIIGWIGDSIGPRFGLFVGALAAFTACVIGYLTLKQTAKEVTLDEILNEEEESLAQNQKLG